MLNLSEAIALAGIEFEQAPCDFCGTSGGKLLFQGNDRLHHRPGKFQFVQCEVCGWVRQDPRPTPASIGTFYQTDYGPFIKAIDEERSAWVRWSRHYGMRRRCRPILKYKSGGSLLDIGCATGIFLNEMRACRAWDVHGIEPNLQAADYARRQFGLDVHTGNLATAGFQDSSFDVITLWNVLEHLHSPKQDINRIHRLLKDDGLFVFTVPSLESLEARWFGPDWIGWELPRHLYLFPRKSLIHSLSALGFSLQSIQCLSGSFDTFGLSLQLYLEDKYSPHSTLVRIVNRAGHSLPVRIVSSPFFWLLNQAKLSTVVTFFAKKLPAGM